MSLQVEKLEGNMAKLTIEASAEEFEAAVEKAYQKNKNKLSVPGFRKGKVPRKMIEQMYGKEIFFEDAANFVIPSAYAKAVDECTEEIVSQPTIDVVQVEAGKPFIFTAEVALKPEVTLGKYKGVEVEKADTTVTEEEVNAAIDKERESNARTISIEDRAVKDGDMTVLDFEGFVDGVAFEGGKGENYPLTIGSNTFIPGFEEQLIGAELNKETEVNVTFPEDYQAAELAGKPAVFKCTIKEIKEKQLPELDDEFASEVSEFDTLAEYKEDVKKNLTEKKEAEAKNAKEDKVVDAIIEDAKMDIPEAMIATQQRQMADDFAQRIQMQGISIDQYFQFTGLTREAFLEQMKPQAEKRIKSRLVLEAVAKAENMEASEDEYKAEIKRMAEAYQMEEDKLTEMIGSFEEKSIKEDLCIKKAVDFVVENAVEK
ncbi:MAG: trigger factor [Lachnospiraceae bacterium]|nr:trigger factor [Lachnospiraceae bacterium]